MIKQGKKKSSFTLLQGNRSAEKMGLPLRDLEALSEGHRADKNLHRDTSCSAASSGVCPTMKRGASLLQLAGSPPAAAPSP